MHSVRGAGFVAVMMLVMLSSCHCNKDPFFGRWTVERVNVEFDENKSTPEMVRQVGALEKDNVLEISQDSMLTLIMDGDTISGRCSLRGTQLFREGKYWGRFEGGKIYTETMSPLGKIEVVYSNQGQVH